MYKLDTHDIENVSGGFDVAEVAIGVAVGLLAIGAAPFVGAAMLGTAAVEAGVVAYAAVGGSIAASGIAIGSETN